MVHVRLVTLIIIAVGIVVSDSFITILKKVQFSTCSVGLTTCPASPSLSFLPLCSSFFQFVKVKNQIHTNSIKFDHILFVLFIYNSLQPWIQTSIMFLGESTSLLYNLIKICLSCCFCKRPAKASFRRLNIPHWRSLLIIPVFAFCDLIATTLSSIGLLYVQASAFQILRGSVLIFNEIGSVIFLKQRCIGYRWMGIILVCFFIHPSSDTHNFLLYHSLWVPLLRWLFLCFLLHWKSTLRKHQILLLFPLLTI